MEKQEGEFSLKGKTVKAKNLGKTPELVKVKIKAEPENVAAEDPIKVDLSKPVDKRDVAIKEETTTQHLTEPNTIDESFVTEITEEEIAAEAALISTEVKEAKRDVIATGKPLPENIEKLVSFMQETGGDIQDYVRLNSDYSTVDSGKLLEEYYKKTKPHLDSEDIEIMLEDFSYDEDIDEDREIRKKKLAFKEEVAKAKSFLEETKSKYYDEIKLRPGVTQDQQKASDFFDRYNEDQDANKAKHERFKTATKNLFNEEFKGFDFNVGEKKFRYGVKNPSSVADTQSDISNFVGKFLNKEGEISDAKGYHKALYAATNADTIAQHFYEQGKADSIKEVIAKSKNISTEPRKTNTGENFFNGWKVKTVGGTETSKLRVKSKKN